jgi:hypothetical protein
VPQRATQPSPLAWRLSPFTPSAELAGAPGAAETAVDAALRADRDGPFLAWLPLRPPPHGAALAAAAADVALRGENATVTALSPRQRRHSAVRRALTAAADNTDDDNTGEALLAAPGWLFAGWSGVVSSPRALGVNGWWAAPGPPPAVALHLVGAVHKTQTLKALRLWRHAAEPPERYARMLALRGASGYLRAAAAQGGAAAGGTDAQRDAAASAAFDTAYAALASRLVRLALAANRLPVLPQVPCDGSWWPRDDRGSGGDGATWGGVRDRERLLPARCALGDWSWRNAGEEADVADADAPRCCYSVAFACDAHVAYASDVDAVLSTQDGGAAAEVDVPMEQLQAQLLGDNRTAVSAARVARSDIGAGDAAVVTLALLPLQAGQNALDALRRLLPAVAPDGDDAGAEGGYTASLAALAGACSRLLADEAACDEASGACDGGAGAASGLSAPGLR